MPPQTVAIEDDPYLAGLVRKRLVPGREIDDAQATVGEGGVAVHEHSGIVWTAMRDDIPHCDRAHAVLRLESIRRDQSRDSTHGSNTRFGRLRVRQVPRAKLGVIKVVERRDHTLE